MAFLLPLLAVVTAPSGLDSRHIPLGSPLGNMPIVVAPGESLRVLQAPLTEKQWLAERRALIARSLKNPRMRAIQRWVEKNEREEAAREAAEHAEPPRP